MIYKINVSWRKLENEICKKKIKLKRIEIQNENKK